MSKKIFSYALCAFFCIQCLSCASSLLPKNMDPASRQFLSEVRYIITRQERNIFLGMPAAEREGFIEEFWKKRDPDPYTEENEFKEQYYNRIEEANKLFQEGTTPGWLQDRGRVHILLGPPERRDLFPAGSAVYEFPTEIWYYGYLPVVFVDRTESGDYRLEPISAQNITLVTKAQQEHKPKLLREEVTFDFSLRIRRAKEGGALIQVEVPYKNIWLAQRENSLQTTLELSAQISDRSGKKVWEHRQEYPISFEEQKLAELTGQSYQLTLQVPLEPGEYSLALDLVNKIDNSRMVKRGKFTL
jgi:GWxTD domain-containing protein